MSVITLGVMVYLLVYSGTTIETFDNDQSFVHKIDQSIYDSFYVDVYDDILFSEFKNEYEIGTILNKTSPTKRSVILDIGSGTGHHVGELTQKGYNCQGIDLSSAMVAKAQKNTLLANLYTEMLLKVFTSNPIVLPILLVCILQYT